MMLAMSTACLRATMIAFLVAVPLLLLPSLRPESVAIIAFLTIMVAAWAFVEYSADAPLVLAFRHATPFNSIRYIFLLLAMTSVTMILRNVTHSSPEGQFVTSLGQFVDRAFFNRFGAEAVADPSAAPLNAMIGLCFFFSTSMVASFYLVVKILKWPVQNGAFNLWKNLPLFEPTSGAEIVSKLLTKARIHLLLAIAMLALTPAAKAWLTLLAVSLLSSAQVLIIWVLLFWFFVPGYSLMHSIAYFRLASMISEQRREALSSQERSFSLA